MKGLLLGCLLRIIFGTGIFYLKDLLFITSEVLMRWWFFVLSTLSVVYPLSGYLFSRKKKGLPQWLKTSQFITDIILAEALIVLTGGIESWFSFTLIIITIVSTISIGKRGSMLIATLGAILYGTLIDLQYYHVIKVPYSNTLTGSSFLYNIFLNTAGIYLTALLMRYMVKRIEKTSETLKQKDLDLRELSRFHSEVVENIPSGLFTTDAKGMVTFTNPAGLKILSKDPRDVIRRPINEIFPFLSIPLPTGRIDGQIRRQDGSVQYIGMNVSMYLDSEGRPIGYIGTFQDVTTIVEMEREIKKREKLSAVGELAASIAHEIRNPLASIKNSLEMLKNRNLPEEVSERLMNIALQEMERLNAIISDFLLYSRPKPPEKHHFCLSSTVKDIIQTFRTSLSEITLNAEIEDDIYITADEERIRQLLWNLLKNAKEAIEEKRTSAGRIDILLKKEPQDNVVLTVSDNGCGIPEETKEKIFFPFFSTKETGTGLGLSVVDRIVQEHNGKIKIESSSEKGTTFRVILPGQ